MFLLPNIQRENLTPTSDPNKYRYGPVTIGFDKMIPYCDKNELIEYILSGSYCWNDLDIPNMPKSENGFGIGVISFALYYGIDFDTLKNDAATTAIHRVFSAISDSCALGIYPEVGVPKHADPDLKYHACPFNPAIAISVNYELSDGDRSMIGISLYNNADGVSKYLVIPATVEEHPTLSGDGDQLEELTEEST